MGFKALSFWTHWDCQEIDSQALTTPLHWFVDGISCWPKLEQNILTTCKSLQAKQTPPKPRQILISVPTAVVAGQHPDRTDPVMDSVIPAAKT